ncbi:MAG: hypothetical protein COU33_01900, partial [Candidatus Magasanikbacteria bacterium CG10_big_fil_rev_8_21_14_0_10_43_6]
MNEQKENEKISTGFTIVEAVVSIVLLITIVAFTAVNIRSGNQVGKLKNARDKIVNDIKKMQSYALAGRKCLPSENATVCDGNTVPSYGFHIGSCLDTADTCEYKLFVENCWTDPVSGELNCEDKYTTNKLMTEGNKSVHLKAR